MGNLHVVVGGQFGSEAKGHVTGWLAKSPHVGAVVRVAGPNAGHTAYKDGLAYALRQIPCAAVTNPDCQLVIAAGSEIDPDVLFEEIEALEAAGVPVRDRLWVDPEATVIQAVHRMVEAGLTSKIGSTAKGIGAARSARIMREAMTWQEWCKSTHWDPDFPSINMVPTASMLCSALRDDRDVIIEGTQGFGLGLHAGEYPYCTSSDCRAIDFLAMVGISPWTTIPRQKMGGVFDFPIDLSIWPVFRTYPIRVAGNSGPMYRELEWAELAERTNGHIQPEKTTVTKKTRRIGEWDATLAHRAMVANGWPSDCLHPVLTFVDYVFPELANVDDRETLDQHQDLWPYLQRIEEDLGTLNSPARLAAFTTGPDTLVSLR